MVASIRVSKYGTQVKEGHFQGVFQKKTNGQENVSAGSGAGAGAVIRIYGSTEPKPNEIFTAPHHWTNHYILPHPG
jgi:hypothetical protein